MNFYILGRNMKFKHYFTLTVIMIILFSLTSIAASENITDNTAIPDNTLADDAIHIDDDLSKKSIENQEIRNNQLSSNEEMVNLSLKIDFKNVQQGNKFNSAGFEIPMNVTVKVSGGTAHNVKVLVKIPNTIELLSNTPSVGTFDSANGIWDIGELTSSDNATLNLLTKLKVDGRHVIIFNATCPNNADLIGSFERLPISNGTVGNNSNTTETSDEKNNSDHENKHQTSQPTSKVIRQKDNEQTNTERKTNGNKNSNPSENNKKTTPTPTQKSVSKSTVNGNSVLSSIGNAITNALRNIANPTINELNSDSKNLSRESIEAIKAYNYTKIPIMIFSAFLILLLCIVGIDKIRK